MDEEKVYGESILKRSLKGYLQFKILEKFHKELRERYFSSAPQKEGVKETLPS